jgi:hypothetical protein
MQKTIQFISIIIFSLFSNIQFLNAQEYLDDYSHNYFLINYSEKHPFPNNNRSTFDTLSLPFIDDFSGSYIYPDSEKWIDNHVFINNGFPVNPITNNVATFDGLKWNGVPYAPHSVNASGIADYLTSYPLDLDYPSTDSIYLSFYYQPRGRGNQPEIQDSLVLQFYNIANETWRSVWKVQGQGLSDFKFVMIPINDSIYRRSGFQFRFLNYCSLSGSFDHWHLDYVFLDVNRTYDDTLMNDVGFRQDANSFLRNYREMPWRQYKANPLAETKDSMVVDLANLSRFQKAVNYTYNIQDQNGTNLVGNSATGSEFPNTTFRYSNFLSSFQFPTNSDDTASFLINNYASAAVDINRNNDTIVHKQDFQHYFAYDDGTAERAYGLNVFNGKIAYKFTLNQPDTLTSIRIHFAQMNQNVENEPFRLTIWSSLTPEVIIYQRTDSVSYPRYRDGLNTYMPYYIPNNLVLSGTFYIGWVQTNNNELNVGFDLNSDARGKMFYNATGSWISSQFEGAWMIRPVFGTPVDDFMVGNRAEAVPQNKDNINVFPNPANSLINISSEHHKIAQVEIFDLAGRLIFKENFNADVVKINIENFENGTYLMRIIDEKSNISTKKTIIYH